MSAAAVRQFHMKREAPLVAYNYQLHEGLLLQMYWNMKLSGDMARIRAASHWPLTDFLHYFKMECALVFCEDSNGIWFAAWAREMRPTIVELSVWVRAGMRFGKRTLLAMETVCARCLNKYPTVVGLSRIELLSVHERLGYHHAGTLPEGIEIFVLTAETFKPRLYRGEI